MTYPAKKKQGSTKIVHSSLHGGWKAFFATSNGRPLSLVLDAEGKPAIFTTPGAAKDAARAAKRAAK